MTARAHGTYSMKDLPPEDLSVGGKAKSDPEEWESGPTAVTKALQDFDASLDKSRDSLDKINEKVEHLKNMASGPNGKRRSRRILRAVTPVKGTPVSS